LPLLYLLMPFIRYNLLSFESRGYNFASRDKLRNFAQSLMRDYDAVKAALTFEWSNGPVEGQVNRLKLIKRPMYGRAEFDLLRQRVLYDSS
jgi:transposase